MQMTSECFKLNDDWLTEARFTINKNVIFRKVGNEGIILHLLDGIYYSLSETSLPAWESISNGYSLQTAVDQITSEYDVDVETVVQELENLIEDFLKYNLISPVAYP